MPTSNGSHNQRGASIVEMLIVITVMLIVMTSVFGLMKNSIVISTTTYEMTDAQENLRTAQEFINRDLLKAGDGLKGINNICVRSNFVTGYLSTNSFNNPCGAGMVTLPLVLSDNNVPANTTVLQTSPSVKVRVNPTLPLPNQLTDRVSFLEKEPTSTFTSITLAANAITANGSTITVSSTDIGRFNVGEIYFITSSAGATFGTVTAKNTGTNVLSFNAGDAYGLNNPVTGGPISMVSGGGTLPASIVRMQIIHYFVDENGLLIRRQFGVANGGLNTSGHVDSVIAEHIVNVQYRYILDPTSGLATAPITQFTTSQQQTDVRQVEVTVTAETVHPIASGKQQSISMTTTTSVRNLQFLEALQP